MNTPFTMNERSKLLGRYFYCLERWQELDFSAVCSNNENDESLSDEIRTLGQSLSEMRDVYIANLPVLPLSRCPFTGQVVYHSIDPYGIDGLWWNYEAPIRPLENLPTTYFALGGALKLNGEVEQAPFLSKPGPEVPYVVPQLLSRSEIKAVISTICVGKHKGYPVFYFADPMPENVMRINTWGKNEWTFLDKEGVFHWNMVEEHAEDFDFELQKWIKSGKLLWISGGDRTMSLHSEAKGCPYLDLTGNRNVQSIRMGKVWSYALQESEKL